MSKKKLLIIGIILIVLLIVGIIVFFVLRQDDSNLKHEVANANLTNESSFEELNDINNTNVENIMENTTTEDKISDKEENKEDSNKEDNNKEDNKNNGNTGNSGSSSGSSDKNDNKPSKPADDDKDEKPSKPVDDDKDEKPSKDPTPTGEFVYKHNSSLQSQIKAQIEKAIENDELLSKWGATIKNGTAGKGHGFTYRGINAHDWASLVETGTNYVYVVDIYCVYSDGSTVKTGEVEVYIYQ